MKKYNPTEDCQNCGTRLIELEHFEPNGPDDYDTELQYECPNGCAYPLLADHELTGEELAERGKVDTMTEAGIVAVAENKREASVL